MFGKSKSNEPFEFCLNPDMISNTEVRQSSIVDPLCVVETIDSQEGIPLVKYHDPIFLLFNQQRLDSLGAGAIQKFLDSLISTGDSALDALRSQCSESDLIQLIKSRYLQSPSEIQSWLTHCSQNMDSFKAELSAMREAQTNVEPPKTE